VFELLASSSALALASALAFGLLTGSFLNVVILRLPPRLQWHWERDSRELLELPPTGPDAPPPGIVIERSHCPKCGHQLAAWENVPLLSFLALRGRCRACKAPISWQYPLVELITGVLFALIVWRFGMTLEALAACVYTGCLVALSGIDLRTTLLPDGITLPLLWIGLLLSAIPLFATPVAAIVGAAVGYLSLWSVYWVFKLLTGKEGMGYGDFKLLAAIGAWCGVSAILPVLLLSSLVGAVIGSAWLIIKGRDRATPIPFGPFLAIAGWIQLYWGGNLLQAYFDLSGLG
jgi:leader peptidase (prepilin peptidase) / N-methyltransferase